MSKDEKARIARENGAKSKGPKTEEGKAKSSQNARKPDIDREEKLARFFPPHSAILCHEEKSEYADLVDELIAIYRPCNQVALAIPIRVRHRGTATHAGAAVCQGHL